jgi:iron(III) transport system ATP-binding protein
MGSNNRLEGEVTERRNGAVRLEGDGWSLWGEAVGGKLEPGRRVGMIRIERVRLADGPGNNRVQSSLVTSMYLGDRWEHLFNLGATRLRAHGRLPLASGSHWLEIPAEDLWVF